MQAMSDDEHDTKLQEAMCAVERLVRS